ncbi:MAG: hypothetical protein ACTTHM_08795 [Peptoanaerobacter stomatis]|uniref:hypothetical protein n=1 Tax=Peptoanaerobacter stomatis TaxID=796937 RepID=UPI003F9FC268
MKNLQLLLVCFILCISITACSSDKYALQNTYISTVDNFYNAMILEEETSKKQNIISQSPDFNVFYERISKNAIYTDTAITFLNSFYNSKERDKKIEFPNQELLLSALMEKNTSYNSIQNMRNAFSHDLTNVLASVLTLNPPPEKGQLKELLEKIKFNEELAIEDYDKLRVSYKKYLKEHPLKETKVTLNGNNLMNFMYVQSNTVDKINGVFSYINGFTNADMKPIYEKLIEITNISMVNIDNVMKGQAKNTDRYKALELLYQSNKKSNEAFKLCLENTKQNSNAISDKIKTLGTESGRLYGNYLTEFNKINFTK